MTEIAADSGMAIRQESKPKGRAFERIARILFALAVAQFGFASYSTFEITAVDATHLTGLVLAFLSAIALGVVATAAALIQLCQRS